MRSGTPSSTELPCPRVEIGADLVARLERFSARFSAARGRRDELGTLAGVEGGSEFVGYRAYHAGDDPRRIDWSAYARLDRPLVRVTRRDAGARVAILVDTSASMGVGPPGKLQRAAETALALAALCSRSGTPARIVLVAGGETRARAIEIDRPARLRDAISLLDGVEAGGRVDGARIARALSDERTAARVFVVSDLLSCEPRDVIAHAAGRRGLDLVRILAPHELGQARGGRTEWFDPEDGARLAVDVDARARARYEVELAHELERWRRASSTARVPHTVHSSASPFEDIARRSSGR